MDENFLSSVFSTPPVILGRQLLPFCCAHASVLFSLNSPYMVGGEISPDEICIAVWICSLTYQEIKIKTSGNIPATAKEFREFVDSLLMVHKLNEANEQFQKYLEEHLKAPARWEKKESKSSKVPWPLTIATNLMRELKFDEDKAWNLSMPMALWYFAAIAEANGDDSLISQEEKAAMEKVREMEVQNGCI